MLLHYTNQSMLKTTTQTKMLPLRCHACPLSVHSCKFWKTSLLHVRAGSELHFQSGGGDGGDGGGGGVEKHLVFIKKQNETNK